MKRTLLALTFIAALQTSSQIPTDNLLVHMNFNQNLTNQVDASIGTVMGDPVNYDTDRFGNHAQSVTLTDIPQSYISLDDINLIDPNYSISFWIRHGAVPASTQFKVLSKREACTGGSFIDVTLEESSQTIILESAAQNDYSANSLATFNHPNTWKHVVFVVDQANETTEIYIDAIFQSSVPWGTTLNNGTMDNNASFLIGHSPCVNGSSVTGYLGQLDDLRIYTRPLTANEVLELFNEPNPTASINENSMTRLHVFPNPVNDVLKIYSNEKTNAVMTSANGREVETIELNHKTTVDVSRYVPGIYFIRTQDGQVIKFVKH